MIEDYEVYFNPESKDIICLVRYGDSLNGHNGIVHGGITALTFDNSFGWLFMANDTAPAFTANLTLNYRYTTPDTTHCIFIRVVSYHLTWQKTSASKKPGNIALSAHKSRRQETLYERYYGRS